jgi:hypothetical protein
MPVREKDPRRVGLPAARPLSRPHARADCRRSAGLFAPGPGMHYRDRLGAGAKEIRTLRPTLNASVPRGATWVPRTAPGFGVAPPAS